MSSWITKPGNRHRSLLLVGIALALLAAAAVAYHKAASPPVTHALYFWKTRWATSPDMRAGLARNDIRKLYLRFFDVEWDQAKGMARPLAPLQFGGDLPSQTEMIPVVYIVNAVFLKMREEEVGTLADQVLKKVEQIAADQQITFRELQLDCDWSDSSRRNYFRFVEMLASELKTRNVIVSSTIRLHQIKYAARTGIPPVDRGMLMFYNFGRIQADSARSSIFNLEDARKYAAHIASYPLKLDVALPLFSWIVHSRDQRVLGLLENLDSSELARSDGFEKVSENRYVARQSFFFRGRYFMQGDLLLVEETTAETTRQAAKLARQSAGWGKYYDTVALFDLNERHFKNHEKPEFQFVFDQF